MAEMILAGTIKDGETVRVSAGKQGLSFNGKLSGGSGLELENVIPP